MYIETTAYLQTGMHMKIDIHTETHLTLITHIPHIQENTYEEVHRSVSITRAQVHAKVNLLTNSHNRCQKNVFWTID